MDNQNSPRYVLPALVAIMLVAAGLRFYGLYWGFPYPLHCDENQLLGPTQRMGQALWAEGSLNPRFSVWGALPMYLAWIFAAPAHLFALVTGQSWTTPQLLLISGRTISALADLLGVYLVFRLGARVSALAGLCGAALYAVALVSVRESHFFTADVLASTLMLFYLLACERTARAPSRKAFALCGVALGLCLSVKVSSAPLAVVALLLMWKLAARGVARGGDPGVSRMARTTRRVRTVALALMFLAVLPPVGWSLQRDAIIARGDAALVERTDSARLETHSPDFWASQVRSLYAGIQRFLITGASAVMLACLGVLGATMSHRGPRMAHEIGRRLPYLLTFSASAVVVFVLLNPYSVLSPMQYWLPSGPTSVTWAMIQVSGSLHPPPGWTIQFMDTIPLLYQAVHVLPYAWGLPLAALLLAGFGYGLYRCRERHDWVIWLVCVAALLLFLTTAGMWMKMTRYLVPLTPVLCVMAGLVWAAGLTSPLAWLRRGAFVAGGAVWVASLLWCVGYVAMYGQEDSRVSAARWLAGQVSEGEVLVLEKDDAWGAAGEAMLQQMTGMRMERYNPLAVAHDRLGRGMEPEHIGEKHSYLSSALEQADWLVLTHNNRDRLRRFQAQFPVINEFYRNLFSGHADFELIASFSAEWRFLGLSVDDRNAEPSFRLFDHPHVYVFRRVAPPGED